MKKALVTVKQAQELKALGFRDKVSMVMRIEIGSIYPCLPINGNRFKQWMSIPTVDEAIDWLRRKYNVIIYNTAAPFVDPTDPKHRIVHNLSVKYCNRRDGWNGRVNIGYAGNSHNIYAIKRRAINIAISWLKQRKNVEKKLQARTTRH